MERILVWNDEAITRNTDINKIIQLAELSDLSLTPVWAIDADALGPGLLVPVSVQFNHTGGTITITLFWSIDGINWVAQAFAGVGDVAGIASATGTGWDVCYLPLVPGMIKIIATEDNVAPNTQFDLAIAL